MKQKTKLTENHHSITGFEIIKSSVEQEHIKRKNKRAKWRNK